MTAMRYLRAANRIVFAFWLAWVLYWVGFVHWRLANELAQTSAFPPKSLPTDFFDEPRHSIHEWIFNQKLNDSQLAQAVRTFYRTRPLPQNVPPPPKGFEIDDPYHDLSDSDLAARVRVKHKREYQPYFDAHWHRFEKYRDWDFGNYYTAALKLSWTKSQPGGLEFIAGLLSPGVLYGAAVLLGRWVWLGSKRNESDEKVL